MVEDVTLTLAFELAALRRLTAPGATVEDARRWSENVLVVTDRPPYVQTKFEREFGVQGDFEAEPTPGSETLKHARNHLDTGRYVHVTVGRVETPDGWTRLPLPDAADDAGWSLTDDPPDSPDGRLDTTTEDWP